MAIAPSVALGLLMSVSALNTADHAPIRSIPAHSKSEFGRGHGIYEFDPRVPEQVIGTYHNVFVATIRKQVGEKSRFRMAGERQLEAEVVYNVKGNLSGSVVVNQQLRTEARELEPGMTYLIATRYSSKYDWYQAGTHAAAIVLISSDPQLTTAELRDRAVSNRAVQAMLKAYPGEVVPPRDGNPAEARNSFVSLPETEKHKVFKGISNLPLIDG